MPVSNDDLLKNINLLGKVLTDIQYQSKSLGSKTIVTLEHVDNMLKRAAKDTGVSPEAMNKLMGKFIKSTSGIGDQSKLIHALEEFGKKSPNYERLGRLISASDFTSFIDKAVEKIKVSPIKLNTKENLSVISKAIARGNREYASSGFGKMSTEFYKKASKDQLNELRMMRKSIQSGEMLSNRNSQGMFRGIVMGTLGQVDDMVLNNAGFGELPGKMATILKTIDDLRKARRDEQSTVEEQRNALLVSDNRMNEASYAEQKRVTKNSKEALISIQMQKDSLQESLSDMFNDVLAKTSLDPKLKKQLENKLSAGTLTTRDIGKIIKNWESSLGDQITPEDKKDMKDFRASLLDDISTLKNIGLDVETASMVHASNLEREKQALINATTSRSEIDRLMYSELEGQFKDLDKRLKAKEFKKNTPQEINSLRRQMQIEITEKVREKYGLPDSEDKGMYSDHSKRASEILIEQGMSNSQVDNELNGNGQLSKAISHNKNFQSSLEKLSDIFKFDADRAPVTRVASDVTLKSKRRVQSTPKIEPSTNLIHNDIDQVGSTESPNRGSGVKSTITSKDIRNDQVVAVKQDAFESMKDATKKSDETIKLLEKVFGKNAEKSVKVEITNWPTQSSQSNTPTISTSPPSAD